MLSAELQEILQAIEKPIQYASGNDYANLKTLKGLEPYVGRWLEKALALPLTPVREKLFRRMKAILPNFDALSLPEKRARVEELQKIVGEITNNHEGPAPPPTSAWPTPAEFHQWRRELQTPIQFIKGVGPRLSELLKKKNIQTVEDALYFLPRRYEDRRRIKTISELVVGRMETVMGTVIDAKISFYRKRRTFEVLIGDDTGTLTAKWFHFNPRYMKGRFKKGMRLILSGEVRLYNFQKEMDHPELEIFEEDDSASPAETRESPPGVEESLHFGRIVPVYSETEGLHQRLLRKILKNVVDLFAEKAFSGIPPDLCREMRLIPLSEAFQRAHFPGQEEDLDSFNEGKSPAHRRLIFDEFFFLELGLALRRSGMLLEEGIAFPVSHRYTDQLRKILPFSLTAAQERVLGEIEADLRRPHPMNRLLQGDVGSGKTMVAFMSGLLAIEAGYQAAIMAPTEILAEQHFKNLNPLVETLGLRAALLTSSTKKAQREALCREIEAGKINLVIGTHALIQEGVNFHRLGLAIVDEQHKFGVLQRQNLKKKGYHPDILVMTATPIPRTLAMTVYGDLDVSVIDQLPPGRGKITTRVFPERERFRMHKALREEITRGRQAYVVYPLVEESEHLDLKDATQMAKHLQKDIFPEFKVGLIHGRMKSEEKEAMMADFKAGRVQILVSTIVIEVGIDVPNASVMVIEHAERFGLSQLHQLRGRVGRGRDSAQCLLIAQYRKTEEAERRLRVMEQTTDGFRISEEDLAIRGPGELLGTQQSGLPDFRVANFMRDLPLLSEARQKAFAIIARDPKLALPQHFLMRETLMERWKGRLELVSVG